MTGMKTAATIVSGMLMPAMNQIESTIKSTVRNRETSCSDRNVLIVSTSEVQRWMMSPVWFSLYHEKGR